MIPHKLGGLGASLIVAGTLGATPAVAAPATPVLVINAPVTHLGYAPGGAVPATIRIENRGTATAHNVVVRLRVTEADGVAVGLPGDSQDCVSDATRSACAIGDLLPGGSANLTVDWRLVRRHYDESAAMSITGAAVGTDTAEGHHSQVDVVVPRNVRLRPGGTAGLPIHLGAVGDTPAEGVFVMLEVHPTTTSLRLTGPRGSTCVRSAPTATAGLVCYLPELLAPGTTSKTWGTTNPFRVTAKAGSARATSYELSILVNAAGAWYRNVGRSGVFARPGDGSWVIAPTVPLTTTVSSNEHDIEDAVVRFRVSGAVVVAGVGSGDGAGGGSVGGPAGFVAGADAAGGAAPGGADAGLPVTGASTALSAGVGLSLFALGFSAVVAARRRRTVGSSDT
jgi:hypothetical protein